MINKFKKLFKTEIVISKSLDDYTQEELEEALVKKIDNLNQTFFDKKDEDKMFDELKNVDGFVKYLQYLMNSDILKYFSAQRESQDSIRGSFQRTLLLKNKLKSRKKLDLKRYK